MDRNVFGALRADLGVEIEVCPPYCHWLNPYAENMIRILKRGTRIRLRNLLGKTIDGSIVTDASGWWPLGMEHTKQTLVTAPSSTITTSTGICATREQHFRQDYDSPTRFNLHPFGEPCFVVLQKSERAIYMFNGQYNTFSRLFVFCRPTRPVSLPLRFCPKLSDTRSIVFRLRCVQTVLLLYSA